MGKQVTVRRVVLDDGTEAEFDGTRLTIGGSDIEVSDGDRSDLAWLITGRRDGRTVAGGLRGAARTRGASTADAGAGGGTTTP